MNCSRNAYKYSRCTTNAIVDVLLHRNAVLENEVFRGFLDLWHEFRVVEQLKFLEVQSVDFAAVDIDEIYETTELRSGAN